jgi:hypothetical protein
VVVEFIDPVKETVDSANTPTVDEEFHVPKQTPTPLELTITFTQQAAPQLADVKV